jgi:signal recognition particle subunit SRP54
VVLKDFSRSLVEAVKRFMGSSGDEAAIREFIREIQRALIRADVNVSQVLELSKKIEAASKRSDIPPGFTRKDAVLKALYEELIHLLGGEQAYRVPIEPSKANVIMMVGIEGSGKTTSAAKLARYYKMKGYKVALISADTYRPAAYDQLKQLAEQIGVPIYGEPGSKDPISIARHGVEKFTKEGYEVIIVDTAGRHKEEKGLIEEMKQIASAIKPKHVMLVIDGTIGQAAYQQAKAFHEATKIGSIFVSKLDGAARGGGALSAVAATGAPISFIGTGEKIEEIEAFEPSSFINRLLGMGDLKSLVERMKEAGVEAKVKPSEIFSGDFTLKDMVDQIIEVRKMGPLSKLLSMIPGMGYGNLPDEVLEGAERNLDKWSAIVNSMTKDELENPHIIDKSRIRRIARGSGTSPKEVQALIDQYFMLKKSLKKIKRMGLTIGRKIPR